MTSFARALPFGANLIDEHHTHFRFWAPAQQKVSLEIAGHPLVAMHQLADGWFEAQAPCGAGAAYCYRLQDGLAVPDPASRAQVDDVHGASLVVDPRSYRWRNGHWRGRPWEETVLYELHAGLLGGFAGIVGELGRLADLGVTALELMPINDFPGARNWGYDGVLPFAPDRTYGTPDELKVLIDAAHAHGLMIFLDVVYNHFGPDGNYLASYAPEFFRNDIKTPWGPAIDFRVPYVRRFFTENALYWLMEYRFDGLRFDAVHAITEADWLDEMAAAVRRTVERDRYVHLVLEHDGNAAEHLRRDFTAQWNDDAHHVLHVMLTGENEGYYSDYADHRPERLARALREGFVYQGEPSIHRDGAPRGTPSADLAPISFVLFLQNHDQIGNRAFGDRLTAAVSREALEAAIALQLLCPQIPLIFMGEDIASLTPFQFFTDHRGELADAVREGRRREFASFAAFSDPARRSRIPDPNAAETFTGSRPVPDPTCAKARSDLYRKLIAVRRQHIMPRLGSATAIEAEAVGPAAVIAQWQLGGAVLWLAANLGPEPCMAHQPGGRLIFETAGGAAALRSGRLAPFTTLAFVE
jgi:malto-oligosyltrehalose trehalohydrolase